MLLLVCFFSFLLLAVAFHTPSLWLRRRASVQSDRQYDLGLPLETGALSNAFGGSYEESVRYQLKMCSYHEVWGLHPNFSLSIPGKYDFDVFCSGSMSSWEKLKRECPTNFIVCPPQSNHSIIGECKLTSDGVVDWLKKGKLSGSGKYFLDPNQETNEWVKCVFVNGGRRSEDFVASLASEEESDIKQLIVSNCLNLFYSPYLSAEGIRELQNEQKKHQEEQKKYQEEQKKYQEEQKKHQEEQKIYQKMQDAEWKALWEKQQKEIDRLKELIDK